MLEPDDPHSKDVLLACRLLARIQVAAEEMSLSPSQERAAKYEAIRKVTIELRVLTNERFIDAKSRIDPLLDALESEARQLSTVGGGSINSSALDGKSPCPACRGAVKQNPTFLDYPKQQYVVYCPTCASRILTVIQELSSDDCFGIDAI